MMARIVSTALLVLLSGGAFLSQATFAEESDGGLFLFFGILSLLLAVLNWFAWPRMRDGWDYGQDAGRAGPSLPVAASFWPVYIDGLLNAVSRAGPPPKSGEPSRDGDLRC
jgi:hypothetical protein